MIFVKINKKKERKDNNGFSLIETLVVVLIFSFVGILTTNAIFLTLRGTQRSQSTLKVREKINYAFSVIQRNLRGAQRITECPNSNPSVLEYLDEYGNSNSFSCITSSNGNYIASGSARLTSESDINITSCEFVCEESDSGGPASVSINISAEDNSISGIAKGKATFTTKVLLRNY